MKVEISLSVIIFRVSCLKERLVYGTKRKSTMLMSESIQRKRHDKAKIPSLLPQSMA